jgi:hypothetical protein
VDTGSRDFLFSKEKVVSDQIPAPEAPQTAGTSPGASTVATDLVELRSGEGFRPSETDEVTRRTFATVILFAGTADSGKTTLLSSLYLLLHKGPLAHYMFAGSLTLVGFEKRVHNCRLASGLDAPNTERSKFSELLHLRVRKENDSQGSRDLLLCDLWGEDFREAKDSVEGCKRLTILRRADAFVLLVDGAKLALNESRQQAKSDVLSLLRNVLDCQMLAETAVVDVLFTKWDIIATSTTADDSERFAKFVESDIKRQFQSRVGALRFARVAAHPKQGGFPVGYGLEALFATWAESKVGKARYAVKEDFDFESASEYDRYIFRQSAPMQSRG